MRRVFAGVALFLLAVAAWLAYRLNDRPSLEEWPRIAATGATTGVSVRFLGVSSLVVSDGTTALVIDGFVSRPSLWRTLAARIAPDVRTIDWVLDRVALRAAAAVIVVHSHYDHAMDAPLVALRTGALLVGSPSTANIARGLGFPEDRLRPADGTSIALGAFRVTTIRSRHFPHGMGMGEISAPLVPPARVAAYREGGSYSVLIEHPAGTLLVQASAGCEEGTLTGRRADVVLLGIAGLATREPEYTERYLGEVVDAVRPRLVVPIHWDDFSRPLTEPLVPLPRLLDDVGLTMRRLADHLASRRVRMAVLPTFEPVVLLPVPDERGAP